MLLCFVCCFVCETYVLFVHFAAWFSIMDNLNEIYLDNNLYNGNSINSSFECSTIVSYVILN